MTGFDVVLCAVAVVAAVGGAIRGAIAQLLGFLGAIAGLVLGAEIGPRIADQLAGGAGASFTLTTLVAIIGGTVVGHLAGTVVGVRMRTRAHDAGASGPDHIAGAPVGIAAFVLVTWFLGAALWSGPLPALDGLLARSQVVAVLDRALPPPPDLAGRITVYLDRQGFPQVHQGPAGVVVAPSVDPPDDAAVAAAAAAGRDATVQVGAQGCDALSLGSGVVTDAGQVTTAAHVVAGAERVLVRFAGNRYEAAVVLFDPDVDLAVLRVDDLDVQPLPWAEAPVERDVEGAVLGFPTGRRDLVVSGASVRARTRAVGRDIYGSGGVEREVVALAAEVRRGASGGPFVTAEGTIGGIVFATAAAGPQTGYALAADWIAPMVAAVADGAAAVPTGACREVGVSPAASLRRGTPARATAGY